jgi:hypothetical protein
MNIELTFPSESIFEFQQGLPPDYRGYLLRGSSAVFAKSNLAAIVLLQLTGVDYYSRPSTQADY